jgi:hypothetical protein
MVPRINEVVATVRSEESRRGLMVAIPPIVESSAMLAEKNSIVMADQQKGEATYVEKKGEELFCTYCNKYRHTREKCWKLNGWPPGRERGNGKPPGREWEKRSHLVENGIKREDKHTWLQAQVKQVQKMSRHSTKMR